MIGLHKYASFIKLEHTLFSIPLLFSGALLAAGRWPSLRLTLLIILAGASARVVALVLNRIIDRDIDRRNPRTKDRHLARGSMRLGEAWLILLISLLVYLLSAWLISEFCFKISWIPILAFGAYPFFKRFTKWVHLGLGLVWSMVPLAGYFSVRSSIDGIGPVLLLGIFSLFWLAGFDIIYATMDETFDRESGLYSLPSSWGSKKALLLSGVFHFLAFVTLLSLYGVWFSGPITVMLLGIVGILLLMEHKLSTYVDLAFFQINTVIGIVVFFFVIAGMKGV